MELTATIKALKHLKVEEEDRTLFTKKIEQYNNKNRILAYIDKSAFTSHMPRTHGYSEIGKIF